MAKQDNLPHLRIDERAEAKSYTSPREGRDTFKMPPRERSSHGKNLLTILEGIEEEVRSRAATKASHGVILVFRSSPEYELALKSLESIRAGIELLAVSEKDGVQQATVFVPPGKLSHFLKLFRKYLAEDTETGKPKNRKLVESTDQIGLAALDQLWMDEGDFPDPEKHIAWEVWLRVGSDADAAINSFKTEALALGLDVGPRSISFPDRVVLLVYGTANQLGGSLGLLDVIAELRRAKECATTFVSLVPKGQAKLADDILRRLQPPPARAGAVCILDSGVHHEQPLLQPAFYPADVLTCFPPNSAADHSGHGTEMAGLALYGDLVDVIGGTVPVSLQHRLESVQILPRTGANHPDVYGAITLEAVNRIAVAAPNRERVFCLAVTATDFRDRGQPSSWSAELDRIACGDSKTPASLFFVAAGNTGNSQRHLYPNSNHTEGVHDPGQSWNAITVGAYTEKVLVTSPDFDGYHPIAPKGRLEPADASPRQAGSQHSFGPCLGRRQAPQLLAPSRPAAARHRAARSRSALA